MNCILLIYWSLKYIFQKKCVKQIFVIKNIIFLGGLLKSIDKKLIEE